METITAFGEELKDMEAKLAEALFKPLHLHHAFQRPAADLQEREELLHLPRVSSQVYFYRRCID
tara:strand:- start:1509 stop:1700 length:192 start_codon:yes stop_codon:yes gene_type:complete